MNATTPSQTDGSRPIGWRGLIGMALSICILAIVVFLTLRPAVDVFARAPSNKAAQ